MSEQGESKELFDGMDLSLFEDVGNYIEEQSAPEEVIDDSQPNIEEDNTGDDGDQVEYNDDEANDGGEEVQETDEDLGKDADSQTNDGDDQGTEESPFTPYAKLLVDEGILPNFNIEEFDGTAEGLADAMRNESQLQFQSYLSTLPEEFHNLVQGVQAGLPMKQLLEMKKEAVKYSEINDESLSSNESLQKDIVRDYYKRTSKFSDERIEKSIQRLADLGELEDEAKQSISELKEINSQEELAAIEQAKQQKVEVERQQAEQYKSLNETIESTNEVIPGIKINPNTKKQILQNLTTPVAYDNSGNPVNKVGYYRSQNPIDFEIKLNYIFEATKGFKDFSVFTKTGRSEAFNELERAAKSLDKNKGGGSRVTSKAANTNLMSGVEAWMKNQD